MRHEERFLTALEGGVPDRVPVFELGMDPWIVVQFLLFLDFYPRIIRSFITSLGLYQEGVKSAVEVIGMSPPIPKRERSLRRRFFTDHIASRFVSQPTTYMELTRIIKNYLRVPRRLGMDGIVVPGLPSGVMKGFHPYGERRLIVDECGKLYDIDSYGNIREKDVIYQEPERMIEHHLQLYRNGEIEEKVAFMENLLRENRGKILLIPFLMGIFETWHEVYGISRMVAFFRQLQEELKAGGGKYRRMLEAKVGYLSRLVKSYSEVGVRCVVIGEDVAMDHGPMLRAEDFKRYFAPLIKKFVDSTHRAGVKVIYHTDGKLKAGNSWSFADAIVDTGIDALHGLQYRVNDPAEIKERYGRKICLVGGVGCVDLLQNASREEVREKVREIVEILKKDGGYIASSDNGWHYGVDIGNVKAYLKTVRKYGKY